MLSCEDIINCTIIYLCCEITKNKKPVDPSSFSFSSKIFMASNTLHCEIVAKTYREPSSLQFDEENNFIYMLTNYRLSLLDLNNNCRVKLVRQHNRKKFKPNEEEKDDDDDDEYSQGESDEDRVEDPYEDSEPSTGDDEESIADRRNWRREAWRFYRLDNPTTMFFNSNSKELIVLNEGVFTFLKINFENEHPFVDGPSRSIFCYDFELFIENNKPKVGIQPWSITPTSTQGFYLFSLLDGQQLYSLDLTNPKPIIEKFIEIPIKSCSYLHFHPESNRILIYDSKEMFSLSVKDKTLNSIDISFLVGQDPPISTMTIDKQGFIYILSNKNIFKCSFQSEMKLIECLGEIDRMITSPSMIFHQQTNRFYISDFENNCVYESK